MDHLFQRRRGDHQPSEGCVDEPVFMLEACRVGVRRQVRKARMEQYLTKRAFFGWMVCLLPCVWMIRCEDCAFKATMMVP